MAARSDPRGAKRLLGALRPPTRADASACKTGCARAATFEAERNNRSKEGKQSMLAKLRVPITGQSQVEEGDEAQEGARVYEAVREPLRAAWRRRKKGPLGDDATTRGCSKGG